LKPFTIVLLIFFAFFFVMMSLVPDCREEQYPCTRLYSVHKPCKQCLNSLCFYSVRRMYVINKEICVRTVYVHSLCDPVRFG
uniref:Microfibril associated protein 2 n=1 Tax=Oryzias melastigma TaxID=30732 RepID=A0A3B3C919_ORYME